MFADTRRVEQRPKSVAHEMRPFKLDPRRYRKTDFSKALLKYSMLVDQNEFMSHVMSVVRFSQISYSSVHKQAILAVVVENNVSRIHHDGCQSQNHRVVHRDVDNVRRDVN